MATIKGGKPAKAKAAPKKSATATKAAPADTKPKKPVVYTPEEQELILKSETMKELAVTEDGVDIAPGISMLPSLRIAAQLVPLKKRADELIAMAGRASIVDADSYARGAAYLGLVKETGEQLETFRVSVKRPIDDYSKFIQKMFMDIITPLIQQGKNIVSTKMLTYHQAEEAKAREAAAAERKKREDEAAALAAQEREKGNAEAAQAIEEAVAATPAPQVQSTVSNVRVGGFKVAVPKTWQGEVVAPMDVLRAIIDGKVPISVLEWSQSGLNAYARTIKVEGTHNGIKLEEKATLGVRG
jgi:hypothetical protein